MNDPSGRHEVLAAALGKRGVIHRDGWNYRAGAFTVVRIAAYPYPVLTVKMDDPAGGEVEFAAGFIVERLD